MLARQILIAMFGIALFATVAEARPRPEGRLTGRRFDANKTFGLGLELGAPTGLTGKWFISADRAIDFGVGDVYNYFDRYGIHIYGDYLFHPVSLAGNSTFELPFYVGIGARIWDFENRRRDVVDDAFAFGIRVPLGIAFDFNNVPLDVFIQLVPVLDFYSGYDAHSIYLDFNVSFGARYFFN